MMASVILVVGFMGMITALTISSEMLATARRQTLAAQIIIGEIDKLRLQTWANLPAAGTIPPSPVSAEFMDAITACGLASSNISVSRTITDLDVSGDNVTDFKVVTFTVQWNKSGTSTTTATPEGSWLDKLAFYHPSSVSRTYTRSMSTMMGRFGLNPSIQR